MCRNRSTHWNSASRKEIQIRSKKRLENLDWVFKFKSLLSEVLERMDFRLKIYFTCWMWLQKNLWPVICFRPCFDKHAIRLTSSLIFWAHLWSIFCKKGTQWLGRLRTMLVQSRKKFYCTLIKIFIKISQEICFYNDSIFRNLSANQFFRSSDTTPTAQIGRVCASIVL